MALEPHPLIKANVDTKMLQNQLGIPVIDLSNIEIPDEMWGDHRHLNSRGRLYYSDILAQRLSTHTTF